MSRNLVAHYSWTGHTRQVAEAVAAALGADVEVIREVRQRSGWIAYIRSVWEALRGKLVEIRPSEKDAASYDLVVVGTPVWAGHMATPVHAYLARERDKFSRIALFCTEGGANGDNALAQMADVIGKSPVATLIVTEKDLKTGAWRAKVADFVKALGSA